MSAIIKKNHIKFNSVKYFRGNAHAVKLGDTGEKSTPIGGVNRVETKGQLASKHTANLINNTGTIIDIDWSSSKNINLKGEASTKTFKLGGGYSKRKIDSGNVKLAFFDLNIDELEDCLNEKAHTARQNLKDEGRDARLVTSVFVILDAELANEWDSSGNLNFAAKKAGKEIELELSLGSQGAQTVQISEGTVFAYGLHKIKWKKDEVKELKSDYYGVT